MVALAAFLSGLRRKRTWMANLVQKLSLHPLVEKMHGNPGVVKATAPRLQGLKVDELQAQLENERTSAGLD